jgi:hypothetical protein
MFTLRYGHACIDLPGGGLMIIGGRDGAENYLSSTEILSSSVDWTQGKELPTPVYNKYIQTLYVLGESGLTPNTAVFFLDLGDPAGEWVTLPGVSLQDQMFSQPRWSILTPYPVFSKISNTQ